MGYTWLSTLQLFNNVEFKEYTCPLFMDQVTNIFSDSVASHTVALCEMRTLMGILLWERIINSLYLDSKKS